MKNNHDIKKAARQHVIGDVASFQTALSLSIGLIAWQLIFSLINSISPQYNDLMRSSFEVLNGNSAASAVFMNKLQNYALGLVGSNLVDGIISGILAIGASWTFVLWRQLNTRPPKPVRQSLRFFKWRNLKDVVVLMAVRYVIMLVGFFFFIIPGIYFALSFALAPFLYASDVQNQREIKSVTAYLRASASLMRGYRMQLLWLNISFIGWWFLVSVTEGLASLYVVPYYQSTMAEFFIARSDEFEKSLS